MSRDWLLPLRYGEDNEECRYAIRSWVANAGMSPGDRLVTSGYCPTWLEPDLHLPGNRHKSGPLNVYTNIRDACASGLLSDRTVVVNDDMYAMEPLDPEAVWYRSTLREHIGTLRQQATWWASSLRLTHNYLRGAGIEMPLSYELHRPLPVDPSLMAQILTDAWSGNGFPVQWRTVYGNLADLRGAQDRDGKISSRRTYPPPVPWWSTTDGTWGWAGAEIRERFPDPSRWERLTHTRRSA